MPSRICFFVTPIGDHKSEQRDRCDKVQNYILQPAIGELFEIIRADNIVETGQISSQIINFLDSSDLVVADLTGLNPNVMYELGIRHAANKPTIQLMDEKEKLPFDLHGERTIFFNISDLASVENCKKYIRRQVENNFVENRIYVSPVASALGISAIVRPDIMKLLESIHDSVSNIESEMWTMEINISTIENDVDEIKDISREIISGIEELKDHDLGGE